MGRDGRGVRAVSESSIEITFMYQGARCRERVALKPTAANLKLAEQHKAAIELSIASGTFDYATTFPNSKRALKFTPLASQQKISSYLPAWLETRRKHLKASTYLSYHRMIHNQLIPWFGDLALVELTKRHIKEKLLTHSGGNSTLSNLQSCLRRAFSDAIEDEILDSNPLAGWKFRTKDAIKEDDDVDPFTPEEQSAILSAARDDVRAQVKFAFWTGLRPCELIALEWGDIDWLADEIRIVRSKTRAAKTPEAPKTSSGRRTIKLLAPAKEALLQQKAMTFLAGGRVFLHPNTGKPWADSEQVRRITWVHAIKKSGVRYRRPYQTRHTYASMMLSAGEHPMWVAKQMGHKDWTMIARIYGRWMPTADASAGDRAVQLFGGNASVMTASATEAAS
ncbi:site-specific integrase [Pseudomonas citronellolis]|uniref:site-specific integrase n=1 Tax=Pseudomonas citronellolis TaxID=53408 RepID=UPI002FD8D8DE